MMCEAIVLSSGALCTKSVIENSRRCKVHTDSLLKHGLHYIQREELKAMKKAKLKKLEYEFKVHHISLDEYAVERYEIKTEFSILFSDLIAKHAAEIRTTGINPDERAYQHKIEKKEQRRLRRQQHILDMFNNPKDEVRELAKLANDKQNIHTQVVVEHTKQIIEKIRTTPVPDEYRWNTTTCSKTPADIILKCNLSPDAAWQMMSKYATSETIYDIEEGIYGKVLDAVWQYVLNSPEKDSLIAIVKAELEDNIGMCAQGNLSRICNILAGYMDGIAPSETPTEMLGRLMPKIMEIDDPTDRLTEANRILLESKLPISEWLNWTVALFDDRIVDVCDGKLVFV